jgi:hypothetical protein
MRRATAILGFISCGLAVASIYIWRELGDERMRNAELRARLQASAPSSAAVTVNKAATSTPAAASLEPLAANIAPAVANPSPAKVAGTQDEWESYRRRLMRDPKYRQVQREQNRLTLAPRRANLIRLLGLTPAQADAIIDLQIDQDFQQADEQTNPATEELRQQQRQRAETREKEYQAKVRELLGDDKQARLDHYMETRGTRMQVDTFRTQLSGVDALRDDQVEPLIEALSVERSQMREELQQYRDTLNWDGEVTDTWQLYGERQVKLMKEMHADMHSSAAAILSSSQLEQLDAMLQRELQRQETQLRMSRIQSKLDSANGPATQPN